MNPSNNQVEYPDTNLPQQNRVETVFGMFETVSVAPQTTTDPKQIPKKMIDQIKIYSNGATYKLYVYNTTTKTWMSVTIA